MRIYEFSKQCGIPTKDLLVILKKEGFAVASHMSKLDQDALAFLNKKYNISPVAGASSKEDVAAKKQQDVPKAKPAVKEKPAEAPVARPQEKHKLPDKSVEPKVRVSDFVLRPMSPADVAAGLDKPASDVILTLLRWGIVATKNQILPEKVVARLADHYDVEVVRPSKELRKEEKRVVAAKGDLQDRPPDYCCIGAC